MASLKNWEHRAWMQLLHRQHQHLVLLFLRASHQKVQSVQGENLGFLAQEQPDHLGSGERQWADIGTQNTLLLELSERL